MSEKVYLHLLLFFCGILYQGIFAELLGNDTSSSSDFLVRKRRVISELPGGRQEFRAADVNYVVKVREGNHAICVGAILSHDTVITAAICITAPATSYKVLSGGAANNQWTFHNVTSKQRYLGNPPGHLFDGISLITVHPTFLFNGHTGYIQLYVGPLPVGRMVTVYGWGYMYRNGHPMEFQNRLRSITLPIMHHGECADLYIDQFDIDERHICTYCARQYCARGDSGAPLVVDNRLAGIHVWKGEHADQRNPDVYINLLHPDYRQWVREEALHL